MRKITASIITLLIFGKNMAFEDSKIATEQQREEKIKKTREIIECYENKIKKSKNIKCRCYGFIWTGPDNIYNGKIHGIDRGYALDKNLKLEEAKKIFFEVVDGLIQEINSHPEISDAFNRYPISYQDFYIRLVFDYDNEGYLKKDDVDQISILHGTVLYQIVDQKTKSNEPKKKWILPNVYTTEGFGGYKDRWILEELPKKKE